MPDQAQLPLAKLPLRVCFLVGDNHTEHCGVKDYANRLARALGDRGIQTEVHGPANWSLGASLQLHNKLRAARFDILHIQYPSIGFRYSLFPHLAGFAGIAPTTCLTLHEYSRLPRIQRVSMQLFKLSTQTIFFTTEEERRSYAGGAGMRVPSEVLSIGSNVPEAVAIERGDSTVLYFGQIRPDKGIEAFLDLARLSLKCGENFQFSVVGACLPRHEQYLRSLRSAAPEGLEWILGESLTDVAKRMSQALAAYLPFSDGASYRRGSLIGALMNGLPIISTCSVATPEPLSRIILQAETPRQALGHLHVLRNSEERRRKLSAASRTLGRRFSWKSIAEAHQKVYNRLRGADRNLGESEERLIQQK